MHFIQSRDIGGLLVVDNFIVAVGNSPAVVAIDLDLPAILITAIFPNFTMLLTFLRCCPTGTTRIP